MKRHELTRWLAGLPLDLLLVLPLALLAALSPASATNGRDPTEPPAEARAAERPGPGGAPAADPEIRHLVTVDGRRYVLDGARRLGVGERLGALRIECIHDDGITVSDDAGSRRRLPLYGAVQIRPTGPARPTTAACPSAPSSKRNPR